MSDLSCAICLPLFCQFVLIYSICETFTLCFGLSQLSYIINI